MSVQTPFRIEVTVAGMTCQHCVMSVTEEIEELPGVSSVEVDLPSGRVVVGADREIALDEVTAAVAEAGFRVAD